MATISSPGLGSGLDVNSIVSQLVALERRPITLLQQQKATQQAKLSAFGLLQSYTVNVHDAVGRLAKPELWEKTRATSSDATAVTATSSASAVNGNYSIEVSRLAQAQALASAAYASNTAPVGSGTLKIELGTWSAGHTAFTPKAGTSGVDIVIEPGADSLEDVRAAINAANAGVSASIVKDATGSRLVLRSTATGEENAVRLTATADAPAVPGGPTLDALSFDPPSAVGSMSETLAALNATAVINGLPVSSASNTLSGVVEGLTLTLAKTTTAPVQVGVSLDSAAMRTAVDDFVKAYNEINRYIADQTKYDADKKVGGTLQGDGATRSLQSQLRGAVSTGSGASPGLARMSDLGIELQRDGSLVIDDAKFTAALANPAAVQAAFTADAIGEANDGFAVRIKALTALLTGSEGLVSTRTAGLRASIDRSDKQIERYEDRVAQTEARLLRQYSALDTSLSNLNGLGSFVSQQIQLWNNQGKR